MDVQSSALVASGLIGGGTALFHGWVLRNRLMRPIEAGLTTQNASRTIRRIVGPLLQFTTFNWLLSGIALIAAAVWFGREVQYSAAFFAGTSFFFGAVGNAWATRGRHPGWILMAVAVALIIVGVVPSGASSAGL